MKEDEVIERSTDIKVAKLSSENEEMKRNRRKYTAFFSEFKRNLNIYSVFIKTVSFHSVVPNPQVVPPRENLAM